MIKARHHPVKRWILDWYARIRIHFHFRELLIQSDLNLPNDRPVVVLGNHFSWWDGLWAWVINKRAIGRIFHVMMLEDFLEKTPILTGIGAYSIKRNSRSILESFSYTRELLTTPDHVVFLYPQGALFSQSVDEVAFKSGIQKLLDTLHQPVTVVFMAVFLDYGIHDKETVSVILHQVPGTTPISDLEAAYNTFYSDAHRKHQQVFADL